MVVTRNCAWILLASLLSIICYPQIELSFLAWVALVPMFFVIDSKSLQASFWYAFLCGFLFFFGTLGWLIYVTWPGAILMTAFLGLYVGIFGWVYARFKRLPLIGRVLALSAAWVVLEYVRSTLFTGFGWVKLGHSQYKNLWLIQISDITGVYGVSFLVILVNLIVFELIKARGQWTKNHRNVVLGTIIVLALVNVYGFCSIHFAPSWPTIKIGVIQPNIDQDIKWEESLRPIIVRKHIRLSNAFKKDKVDMVVWPETSLPGIVGENGALVEEIKETARVLGTPLIFGGVVNEQGRYYNSALYIDDKVAQTQRYDKIHLVPFGEYLPLRPLLGWINRFVPLEDFTSGAEYKILTLGENPKARFGVLICFEDALSDLRRTFTKAGAQFFVNITNDAWFEDTKAPFLHAQTAALASVEVKRALVRSANTGVSAFIDPYGRIYKYAQSDFGKKSFISATAAANVPMVSTMTLYTKYGDVFTFVCFLGILWAICCLGRTYGKENIIG